MTALTLEGLQKTFPRAGLVVNSVDLHVEDGEFFTLLGPSGCGKSTILRIVAGFEEPTGGRVLFDGRVVTFEPPNRRNIGFVFQNYALFPHMSVAKNVAFGLDVRKIPAVKAQERITEALHQVQLLEQRDARVDQLSGGQQQRVALARALVIQPQLLLLDEPLSNLDAKLREETRATLRRIHNSNRVTTIYVTHDQTEAMGMSDRIAVLNAGRIQQIGIPAEIYSRPANRFVAAFIGRTNLVDADITKVAGSSITVRFDNGHELTFDASNWGQGVLLQAGARVGVCIKAESLQFTASIGTFQGRLLDTEYAGPTRSCTVESDVGLLRVELPGERSAPAKGELVQLSAPATAHLVESA